MGAGLALRGRGQSTSMTILPLPAISSKPNRGPVVSPSFPDSTNEHATAFVRAGMTATLSFAILLALTARSPSELAKVAARQERARRPRPGRRSGAGPEVRKDAGEGESLWLRCHSAERYQPCRAWSRMYSLRASLMRDWYLSPRALNQAMTSLSKRSVICCFTGR